MKFLTKLKIVAFIAFFYSNSADAQTVTTTLDATVRDISEVNIGFNRRSDGGPLFWTNTSFQTLLTEMNPDILRYPGGTQGNYWDWSTGQFIPNTDKPWNNREVVTIAQFMAGKPSATKVIYMANLARPTPATGVDVNASEAILKSQATLNVKIADMIDAIDEFVAQGQEPYAVEIGNEFYFGNEEGGIFHITEANGKFYSGWDATANGGAGAAIESNNKKDATDVNAEFYLQQAKDVVAGIKAAYPNMKFALISTKRGNGTSARERWNNTIYNELNTNPDFSQLKQDVHALTQHHYVNDAYNAYGVSDTNAAITDATTAKQAIAEGIQYPLDKQLDYDQVPSDYKIWFTEYGATKNNAEDTWAAGMRHAALTYSWLSLGDKTEQLDFHHITDNNVVKPDATMRLASAGVTTKQFMAAMSGMTEMQKINFGTNPISVGTVNSLYGYKFKSLTKETILVLNVSDTGIQNVKFDNLLTYTGTPTMTQYRSNAPWVSGVAQGDTNIILNNDNILNTFNARKFSITVIEVLNETLSVDAFSLSNISVFPNPVKEVLTINTDATLKAVSVFNISGKEVYTAKTIENNSINLNNLATGMYILKVETDKGIEYKKLIKE